MDLRTSIRHVLAEAATTRSFITESILTAKTLGDQQGEHIRVVKSGYVQASGVRNGVAQIWQNDRGVIIGDDGNRYTIMLDSSGRVLVPYDQFADKFEKIPDEELIFSRDD